MANRYNVERLLALPYFNKSFDAADMATDEAANRMIFRGTSVDPVHITEAAKQANVYIVQGILKLMSDHYIETLTDEEVNFLREALQHPAFTKMTAINKSLGPLIFAWLEENEGEINRSIDAALAQQRT